MRKYIFTAMFAFASIPCLSPLQRPSSHFRGKNNVSPLRKPVVCRAAAARVSTRTDIQDLPWEVTIPSRFSDSTAVYLSSPPFVAISNFLSPEQCCALVTMQQRAEESEPERANYLNYDSGSGHGYRQGVDVSSAEFAPIMSLLRRVFPARERVVFEEALWHRPRTDSIIVRDVTTVRYRKGERVSSHVDGKDLTVLIYLQEPTEGGETVFENAQLSFAPLKGQALLYESKHKLTHHAAQVRSGEKWVLQLLIDYRVRADDVNF